MFPLVQRNRGYRLPVSSRTTLVLLVLGVYILFAYLPIKDTLLAGQNNAQEPNILVEVDDRSKTANFQAVAPRPPTFSPMRSRTKSPVVDQRAFPEVEPYVVKWSREHNNWRFPITRRKERAKIVDGFVFNSELDQLELRLETLDPVVDYFVLVESPWTFQDTPKKLVFAENKQRFAKFLHKIVYYNYQDRVSGIEREAFAIENAHRNGVGQYGIRKVLLEEMKVDLKPEDIVFITDLDEMPRPDVMNWLAWHEGYTMIQIVFSWRVYGYMFKSYKTNGIQNVGTSLGTLREHCKDNAGQPFACHSIRIGRCGGERPLVLGSTQVNDPPKAGWHCSWCFPVSMFVNKMQSFVHKEYLTGRNSQYEYLKGCRQRGQWFAEDGPAAMMVPVGFDPHDEFAPYGWENVWGHKGKWDYLIYANLTGDEPSTT